MQIAFRFRFDLLFACAAALLPILSARADPREHQGSSLPNEARPVQVFVLMGQSNMVGMGDISPETTRGTLTYLTKTEKKYPFLVDPTGQWTTCPDVYYYDARVKRGAPLSATANNGRSIGPELGFGYTLARLKLGPILLLKSCTGNRSLGWDLLPPGSQRFTTEGRTYAGYKDTPASWVEGQPKEPVNWYAGKQYDDDLANARTALEHIADIYPGYKGQGYQIAGFVWWQGHKDQNPVYASRYEQNLQRLIRSLRADYKAPNAKSVLATIAFDGWKLAEPGKTIAQAQLNIADPKKHVEFTGTVKCVEARDFWRDASVSPNPRQGYHYNRNAETYMEVGIALGNAMIDLFMTSHP